MKGAIDQLELIIGDLETDLAETTPSAPEPDVQARRRKPKRRPLPENLPRDVMQHPAACACPKCGGALRRLGEDVTEVLEYIPGSFRVTRHVPAKNVLPLPREHHPGPGSQPADLSWSGGSRSAGACPGGKVLRSSAVASSGRNFRSEWHRPGSFHSGGLGRSVRADRFDQRT